MSGGSTKKEELFSFVQSACPSSPESPMRLGNYCALWLRIHNVSIAWLITKWSICLTIFVPLNHTVFKHKHNRRSTYNRDGERTSIVCKDPPETNWLTKRKVTKLLTPHYLVARFDSMQNTSDHYMKPVLMQGEQSLSTLNGLTHGSYTNSKYSAIDRRVERNDRSYVLPVDIELGTDRLWIDCVICAFYLFDLPNNSINRDTKENGLEHSGYNQREFGRAYWNRW